jgi:hypothetical protein
MRFFFFFVLMGYRYIFIDQGQVLGDRPVAVKLVYESSGRRGNKLYVGDSRMGSAVDRDGISILPGAAACLG